MICIIMGVAGSGKSTIGSLLSQRTGWPFYDGDRFHPPTNIEKMRLGIPLNDAERYPWLMALRNLIHQVLSHHGHAIIACSALKADYRNFLQAEHQDICWVYLKGDYSQILERLQQRQEHFMKAELLRSQFDALEEPEDALIVSVSLPPDAIATQILTHKLLRP
ncbi:MAG: gluconokinase [Microcystaceae cyanobacterium]